MIRRFSHFCLRSSLQTFEFCNVTSTMLLHQQRDELVAVDALVEQVESQVDVWRWHSDFVSFGGNSPEPDEHLPDFQSSG